MADRGGGPASGRIGSNPRDGAVCLISLLSRRSEPPASITEAQARENAAPLTTAIFHPTVERTGP